ncbi:MAG TPA: metallopeptidase TldD-related protein [Bryobacteraceae bacterium]|nr:metallopeptidase TldD-related protein [Bryobacteraceae bacterium]
MIDVQIAVDAVRLALERGATDAECTLADGDEFSARVRMRELETLKEAGSQAAGLRVLMGRRAGSGYTSDLTREGVRQMVESAVELAGIATEDPFAGLPDDNELGSWDGDLKLWSDDVASLEARFKIDEALAAEQAALAADERIVNSEGASFDSWTGGRAFANSRGFAGAYRTSSCSLSVTPVARQDGRMERDYWFSLARSHAGLEPAAEVGRRAAERALRRLGSRKLPTCKVPVIFEPRTARTLVGHIFEAVNGDSVYRSATFLAGRLGERAASEQVTVVDDGTIPGLFGSSPFDDEGVPSRRTVVIERGVLKTWLLNSYAARRLGMKTTGNAARGVAGNASIGHGNFFLEPGDKSEQEIVRGIGRGLYVTELIGSGVNIVTGDYSRGAAGLWIEGGEFAYPVSEITIAGKLPEMLTGITQVGSELEFRGSTASPALVIGEMTVSGR